MTAVVAVLAVTAVSGRGGTPSAAQIASTGSVNINGNDVKTPIIRCYQQDWFRAIAIGASVSRASIGLDVRAEQLSTKSVRIQKLGGFTGMYSPHDDVKADTTLSNGAYTVKGTAEGHKADQAGEPATADFRISVRC